MKRREFGKVLASGAIGTGISQNNTAMAKPSKALMYAGNHQGFGVNDKDLLYLQRFGVTHKIATPTFTPDKGWNLDEILQMKDKCMEYNITLEGLVLPYRLINKGSVGHFMLDDYEKGDREIEIINDCIRVSAQAGMRVLFDHIMVVDNNRTQSTPGRGGVRYSTWDLEKSLENNPPNFYDTVITAEENWERNTYYLERVIPVATEYKVQMAFHPCDPWLPPGYRGINRVLGGFEGFKFTVEADCSLRGRASCGALLGGDGVFDFAGKGGKSEGQAQGASEG